VKKVVGSATAIKASGESIKLIEGMVLVTGDTVKTEPASFVDLWLGVNGDSLRVEANATVKLEALEIVNVKDRVVDTALMVTKGEIIGNVVNKLASNSKYQIKTAAGIAGVRGTIYSVPEEGMIIVAEGEVMFSFVQEGVSKAVRVGSGQLFKIGDAAPSAAPPVLIAFILQQATQLAKNTGAGAGKGGGKGSSNPTDTSVSSPSK
jgi:hypothetical protein